VVQPFPKFNWFGFAEIWKSIHQAEAGQIHQEDLSIVPQVASDVQRQQPCLLGVCEYITHSPRTLAA